MTVSQNDGVPKQTAMGCGILNNKKVYKKLGLSVPKTWAEFAADNEKIKKAGITPIIATYGDSRNDERSCKMLTFGIGCKEYLASV